MPKTTEFLPLIGENLCLNFANTTERTMTDQPREWLTNYADLLNWAGHAGCMTDTDQAAFNSMATMKPNEADEVFQRALKLREAVRQIFLSICDNKPPSTLAMSVLNQELRLVYACRQLGYENNQFVWAWAGSEHGLESVLWPIIQSAAELLTSTELKNLKQCANPKCTWLFLDISRNHRRRWCEMEVCGNQEKARQHYYRNKQADS